MNCSNCGVAVQPSAPFCPGCGASLQANAVPAVPSVGASATAVILIMLLVLVGLFWLGLAGWQLWWAFAIGVGWSSSIAWVGIWNLVISGFMFTVIREVLRRRQHAISQLMFIAVVGSIWGLVDALWLHAWLQLVVVPLYVVIGALTWENKEYFTVENNPQQAVKSFVLTSRDPTAAPPVRVPMRALDKPVSQASRQPHWSERPKEQVSTEVNASEIGPPVPDAGKAERR